MRKLGSCWCIASSLYFCLFFIAKDDVQAQGVNQGKIQTGATFLGVNPDVRSAGMGVAGVAAGPDISALALNPAKLPFISQKSGAVISYCPWMSALSRDIYLAYAGGFYKLNESSALGSTLRYFSYGRFELSDQDFTSLGEYRPVECSIDISYGRKLGENFGIATTARYIYSGLASSNAAVSGISDSGSAFAMDVSLFQSSALTFLGDNATISTGVYISNLGTKLNYDNQSQNAFLPANLKLGVSGTYDFDENNSLTAALDFNKLLVPSNSSIDQKDESTVSSYFRSFNDSAGGLSSEFNEVVIGTGLEYTYLKSFALRTGYHYESPKMGYQRYFTFGAAITYRKLNFDIAYIAASAQTNPLGGTMRVGLGLYL